MAMTSNKMKCFAMATLLVGTALAASAAGNQAPSGATASTTSSISGAAAQTDSKVSGVVLDEKGNPVIGAGVFEKGTNNGTVTDENGKYTLTVSAGSRLVVSCVGYTNLEIGIAEASKIVLSEDVEMLDDVVVIGYGTARKGDLTGSISSVGGDKVSERSTTQLTDALQGQIAGVEISRSGGGPGSSGSIRIRGVTTLSNNEPLVIVDGVPSSLNDVLASDIETISVLKDAASAAIYGSRAAAGVVLITTKRAKNGSFNLDYNFAYSVETPTARPKNTDAIGYMNVQNEIKFNDGAASDHSIYSEEYINSYMANNAKDPYHYPNVDWTDLLLKETTTRQQHTFSLSGGTDKLRTKATFNYQKGDGWYINRSYERFAARVNNDFNITKWLNASINVDLSKSESVKPNCQNLVYAAFLVPAIYNYEWEDGRPADVKSGANYWYASQNGGTNNTEYYKAGAKAQLNITPFKGLTLTAIASPRFSFTKGKSFSRKVDVFYEDGSSIAVQSNMTTNLNEARNDSNNITYQFYGNYQTKLADHSINLMAGYEAFTNKWEDLGASRNNYLLTNFPYLNLGPEDYQYNSGKAGHNAYQSVFGRLMYSFKNKYLIQANVRADASSRFAKAYRWGVFPSVSAGWVISDEPWFKNPVVGYLKLRGSIGQLGNERIGSEFPYMAAINFGSSYMYDKATSSVTAVQNAAQWTYAFENITWETTTTYGLGIDASLLDSRLSLTGDYYYKKTENMLLTLGFPSYAGFSAPQQNAGDMYTNGWDLELRWADRKGDFSYSVSANVSDYRSKMGYLGDKRTIDGNKIYEKGSYYYEWFMYETDGLFQTEADLIGEDGKKVPTLTANDKPGNIKYVDQNGDGVINADDKVRLGNSMPEYLYGGNVSLGWKNLDFSLSFQGIGHQRVLMNTAWVQPLKEQWGAVPEILMGNYWSQHNTPEQNLKAKYPRLTYANTTNTYTGSDFWLFNGAYFRIKNITLGYTMPESLMKKTFIRNLRLYASVSDLPAISNYPKGFDPEVGGWNEFIATSFTFGLNVKF